MATPDTSLRFLGVEILVQGSGFVLSQQAYAEELLRLNNVKPTALGKIPCPRDLACFDTLLADAEETVRVAQRLTGEILWLSQRTRPDLAYTACLLASLSTKAPERAIHIAERALAYIQRTKAFVLTAGADDTGLIAYSDASYAPKVTGRTQAGLFSCTVLLFVGARPGRPSSRLALLSRNLLPALTRLRRSNQQRLC